MSGREERWARAIAAALAAEAPRAPQDLKAELLRRARRAGPAPWWRRLLEPAPWGVGLGAAMAAAGVLLALRDGAPRPAGGGAARPAPELPAREAGPAPAWRDGAAARGLEGLWTEDDGGDDEG